MKNLSRIFQDICLRIWERFVRSLQERTIFTFFVVTVIIIAVTAVTFRIAENDQQESLWRTVVYIVSGLDVDPPQTPLGRITATFVIFCGVVLASMLTAFLASEFSRLVTSSQSVRQKPQNYTFEDHVIIVGWGPKRKEVLRQLNQTWESEGYRADDIVILSDHEYIERGAESIYDSVWHVRGNASDQDALREADLVPGAGRGAKIAVIMGDFDVPAAENDRQSLLNLLAFEHLHPEVLSLAEVQIGENKEHFKNANADELVLPNEYTTMMLARTAEYRGVASWFDELLALAFPPEELQAEADHPISFYVFTAQDLKLSGMNLIEAISEHYCRTQELIVGLIEPTDVRFFPDLEDRAEVPLEPKDKLIVVSRPRVG